jgi:hypothetical protein
MEVLKMVKININTENDAFQMGGNESPYFRNQEVVRILRKLADNLEENITAKNIVLLDINGNSVGNCIID